MNRLDQCTHRAREKGAKLFCAYVTLGFPSLAFTEKLIPALEQAGVDILELGIPFSDPMADGPVIQHASYTALQRGTRVADAFRLVKRLRQRGLALPVVFFSYYNIMYHMGREAFVRHATRAGIDAVLCPDLPPDEDPVFARTLRRAGLKHIALIAPTSTVERRRVLARMSGGFIYYVSRRGVTGKHAALSRDLRMNVQAIKRHTTKPVLVGFGIGDRRQVTQIATYADGVIVGSAIVDVAGRTNSVAKTASFVRRMVEAVKK